MTRLSLLVALGAVLAAPAWAAIEALEAFPGARQEANRPAEQVASHDFVLGAVERTGGAMRAKLSVRVGGTLEAITWEIIGGFTPDEVREHYRRQLQELGFEVLFECRARDCGKSTVWANSVFGQAVLYGPDPNQRYLAARRATDTGEVLAAVYVIQRANRRVYAHVELLATDAPSGLGDAVDMIARLERDGVVVLAGVTPDARGELDEAAREALAGAGAKLRDAGLRGIFVVCHLYGPGAATELTRMSQRCAEDARSMLDPDDVLGLVGFGAGPFAPGDRGRRLRVELVTPL